MRVSRTTAPRGFGALARSAGIATAILAATALIAGPAATAATTAGKTTIYNNFPKPLPGNVVSLGYEATATSEFGGQVELAGTARHRPSVKVLLSSWGCESGFWSSGDCGSTPGSKFSEPITVNVYAVGANDEPGALLGSVTHTFKILYRPSANYTKCTGVNAGKWYKAADDACYNGKAQTKTVTLGSIDLPDHVIISVAYNTTHYGYQPIGEGASCFTSDGGCGYDALNVGVGDSPAAVGSQPLPDDAYVYSTSGGSYCDGGAGGTGVFRLDAGCNTDFQPGLQVKAR